MDTPSTPPADHQDNAEAEQLQDHVCDGSAPKPVSRKTMGKFVSGIRGPSAVSEQEPDTDPGSLDPLARSEKDGSSFSICSSKLNNSSSCLSSDESYQPDTGADDCATLLLACLHCHFDDLMVLLPGSCERAVQHCFPSYKYIVESDEREQQGQDCCSYRLEWDCNFCGSCQDAGELIELAMEISEVCYR